jgi:hypothetical protein
MPLPASKTISFVSTSGFRTQHTRISEIIIAGIDQSAALLRHGQKPMACGHRRCRAEHEAEWRRFDYRDASALPLANHTREPGAETSDSLE